MKRSTEGLGAGIFGIQRPFAAAVLVMGSAASLAAHGQGQLAIFGTVDVYAGHASQGARSWTRLESGGNAESRLGFRGTEDIGGGMSARFMLEAGFNTDTGGDATGTLSFARQSWVGLAGPAGSLQLGRMYTPMFQAMARAEPFALNTVFSPMNLGAASFATSGSGTAAGPALRPFTARGSNMLRYRTPASDGLFLDMAYAFAESASGDRRSGELYGGAVGWDSGPLYGAYAFQGTRFGAATTPAPAPVITRYQAMAAAYKASRDLQVFAILSRTDASDSAIKGARLASAGAAWNATPVSRVLLGAAQRKTRGERASRLAWTVGYDHALSRRTVLYGRLLGAGDHGAIVAAAATTPTAGGMASGRLLALGMRHTF